MAYVQGFKELSEADASRFFDVLGMSKEKFLSGLNTPAQRMGYPPFRSQSERWIDLYREYAKSLPITEKASLHRSINRLFFSLKEGRFISAYDHFKNRDAFRHKYIIPENMRGSVEAEMWLAIAGAYVTTLLENNKAVARKRALAEFEKKIPALWLDIQKVLVANADDKRSYRKFVIALNEHWSIFIASYRNEVHGTVINNAPVAASLNAFLTGSLMGKPLRRTNPLVYWPRPLSHYAEQDTAWQLYNAKKAEINALKPILSSGYSSSSTIYSFPRWLRLGIDGVDPTVPPPLRRYKSSE